MFSFTLMRLTFYFHSLCFVIIWLIYHLILSLAFVTFHIHFFNDWWFYFYDIFWFIFYFFDIFVNRSVLLLFVLYHWIFHLFFFTVFTISSIFDFNQLLCDIHFFDCVLLCPFFECLWFITFPGFSYSL